MKRVRRYVISFHSRTEAMVFEAEAKAQGFAGRLIPKPREISSSCGTAYMGPLAEKASILALIEAKELANEGVYELSFQSFEEE